MAGRAATVAVSLFLWLHGRAPAVQYVDVSLLLAILLVANISTLNVALKKNSTLNKSKRCSGRHWP